MQPLMGGGRERGKSRLVKVRLVHPFYSHCMRRDAGFYVLILIW